MATIDNSKIQPNETPKTPNPNSKISSNTTISASPKSAREAYLLPLLERHNRGETISYEDLETSFQKGKIAIQDNTKLVDADKTKNTNDSLLEDLNKLHQSQIQAYENTARLFLKALANQFSPPPITKEPSTIDTTTASIEMDEKGYLQKCVNDIILTCEGWKVSQSIIEECVLAEVRKKAHEYYNEQKTATTTNNIELDKSVVSTDEKLSNGALNETSSNKLPIINENTSDGGEENENDHEEDGDEDAQDEEITSETDTDGEEGEVGDESNPSNKVAPTQESENKNANTENQKKTKISLFKVNRGKRQFPSPGQTQIKKLRTNSNAATHTSNSAQPRKVGRGGNRGRGRSRRRGGKN